MLKGCNIGVPGVFQIITGVLQSGYRGVHGCNMGVTGLLQVYYRAVTGV